MKYPAYRKYKDSGVEWLGDVPEHWEVKRLKTSAKYFVSNVDKVPSENELPVRLCNYTDVYYNDFITSGMELMETTATKEEIDKFHLFEEDVIITKDSEEWNDIAISALVTKTADDLVCGYHLAIIRPIKEKLTGRYLLRQFQCSEVNHQFQVAATGVTRFGLPKNAIGEALIPLPPLPEQRALADLLDRETGRIDTLIGKKERLIELLKEKRTALISHAVTKGLNPNVKMKPSGVEWLGDVPEHWKILPLRRLVKAIKTGGTPTGAEESAFDDDGFNWYSPGDFEENTILEKSNRALSEEGRKEVREFPPNTVMIVGIGATIGKVALSRETCSCNQQINGIVCDDRLYFLFATYYLKTMRNFIVKCGKYTTLPIINQDETKNIIFPLPPLTEQQAITEFLDLETAKIDTLITKVESAIEKLKEYRTALISAAVTGKIDVREVA